MLCKTHIWRNSLIGENRTGLDYAHNVTNTQQDCSATRHTTFLEEPESGSLGICEQGSPSAFEHPGCLYLLGNAVVEEKSSFNLQIVDPRGVMNTLFLDCPSSPPYPQHGAGPGEVMNILFLGCPSSPSYLQHGVGPGEVMNILF